MQTLPPIQLPGARPPARRPLTTHAIAAATSAALAIGGTVAYQQTRPDAPIEKAAPMPTYESRLRDAWAQDRQPGAAANRRKLIFMYRAVIMAVEMGEMKTLAELYKASRDQEAAMGMTAKLPVLRAVITAEWNAQLGEGAGPITPGMRVDISAFMRQTVTLLEGVH